MYEKHLVLKAKQSTLIGIFITIDRLWWFAYRHTGILLKFTIIIKVPLWEWGHIYRKHPYFACRATEQHPMQGGYASLSKAMCPTRNEHGNSALL
jgi:hypothetical protein